MKKYWLCVLTAALLLCAGGCTQGGSVIPPPSGRQAVELPEYVEEVVNLEDFAAQGAEPTAAQMEGIALSPLFRVDVDGTELPVYCVPVTAGGPHSFAMLDAEEGEFPMQVTVTVANGASRAQILPERRNVTTHTDAGRVTFTLTGYGDYTLVVDGSHVRPLSFFVRPFETPEVPRGAKLIEYRRGIHFVDSISLESNTVLYLHAGALLVAKQPTTAEESPTIGSDWAGMTRWKSFISAEYQQNVTIAGHGVVDLTNLNWHARSPISVVGCENVNISGIALINAPEWNITVPLSKHIEIRDVVIFGYRQNSDGIALVDSQDALVEDCFIRSGDDLFEVKSNYKDSESGGKDIVYRNCTAWADKCRGFGVIQETKNDMQNLLFEGCSMLYRMQDWSEELGSLVVIVGDGGHISDVTFRDIEVHYDKSYVFNVSLGPTDWSAGEVVGAIDGVTFEDIRVTGNNRVRIRGNGAAPDNIRFKDVTVDGKKIGALGEFDVTYVGTYGTITVQ